MASLALAAPTDLNKLAASTDADVLNYALYFGPPRGYLLYPSSSELYSGTVRQGWLWRNVLQHGADSRRR